MSAKKSPTVHTVDFHHARRQNQFLLNLVMTLLMLIIAAAIFFTPSHL